MPEVSVEIPMRLPSRANSDGQRGGTHWQRAKLVKQQRFEVAMALLPYEGLAVPVTVQLTRVSPRSIDSDNLSGSLKAVRDAVAEWLGVDDADDRVTWLPCKQRRDPLKRPRYQAAHIEIWRGQAQCPACRQDIAPTESA